MAASLRIETLMLSVYDKIEMQMPVLPAGITQVVMPTTSVCPIMIGFKMPGTLLNANVNAWLSFAVIIFCTKSGTMNEVIAPNTYMKYITPNLLFNCLVFVWTYFKLSPRSDSIGKTICTGANLFSIFTFSFVAYISHLMFAGIQMFICLVLSFLSLKNLESATLSELVIKSFIVHLN